MDQELFLLQGDLNYKFNRGLLTSVVIKLDQLQQQIRCQQSVIRMIDRFNRYILSNCTLNDRLPVPAKFRQEYRQVGKMLRKYRRRSLVFNQNFGNISSFIRDLNYYLNYQSQVEKDVANNNNMIAQLDKPDQSEPLLHSFVTLLRTASIDSQANVENEIHDQEKLDTNISNINIKKEKNESVELRFDFIFVVLVLTILNSQYIQKIYKKNSTKKGNLRSSCHKRKSW